jgi:hypothetical protein
MRKTLTKSQIIAELAQCDELKKKQVAWVLEGQASWPRAALLLRRSQSLVAGVPQVLV